MTTETENKNKTPDFYIFVKDPEGNSTRIGAAFRHNKGQGMNILINEERYVAFPPKKKDESPTP